MTLNGKIFKFKAGKPGGSVGYTASVLERERDRDQVKMRNVCDRDRERARQRDTQIKKTRLLERDYYIYPMNSVAKISFLCMNFILIFSF